MTININKTKFLWMLIICVLAVLLLISVDAFAAGDSSTLFSKGETKLTEATAGIKTWFWRGATLAGVITFIMFLLGKAQWKILGVIAIAIFGVASITELVDFIK